MAEPNLSPVLMEIPVAQITSDNTVIRPFDIYLRFHADRTVSWSPQSVMETPNG